MALNYTVYQYDGNRNAVVMTDMEGKERLVAYMRKLNIEVNNVYKTVNEGKFGNE